MRLTNKIFDDLAIFMIILGIGVGIIFPFFSIALGVPYEIALTPIYFIACMLAGVVLAILNITLSRKTVGSRIRLMSEKMKHVEAILTDRKNSINGEVCDASKCLIDIDSEDELGESAEAFNRLVISLSELLEVYTELQMFSELLTTHLDLEKLSKESLNQMIRITGASGGAILIENSGELLVKASESIKDPLLLERNEILLDTMRNLETKIISLPSNVIMNGILVDFLPKELFIQPILYKNAFLGIVLLASTEEFPKQMISYMKIINQELSLAFRNSITHEHMTQLAAIDPLTSLYNRRFGTIRLQEEFSRAIRSDAPLSVLMFDVDHFKTINDTYGHAIGDKVLVNISKIALSAIREGDILLRYGGEEFLCILPGASQTDAIQIAERIRMMIMDSHVQNRELEIRVTVSIGLTTYPNNDIYKSEELVKLADEAMYIAKNNGRNKVEKI